jgi:hypothetical protein
MGYAHGRDQPIVVGSVARLAANRRRTELATFTAGTAARSDDARDGRQASTRRTGLSACANAGGSPRYPM